MIDINNIIALVGVVVAFIFGLKSGSNSDTTLKNYDIHKAEKEAEERGESKAMLKVINDNVEKVSSKLDKLVDNVNEHEKKIENIDTRVRNLEEDVEEIKGEKK